MTKNYNCEACTYSTSRKSSYTDHLSSKKHLNTVKKITENEIKKAEDKSKVEDEDYTCTHCGRSVTCLWNLKRHYTVCNVKKISDIETDFEKKENRLKRTIAKQKQKLEEIGNINEDYADLIKQIALSKIAPKMVNIHYIINNFTEALNYEDLMDPALTPEEAKKLGKLEPLSGSIYMIDKRCIEGIDVRKRPLHCLDSARHKYLLRTNNEWVIDHNARKIFKEVGKHMYNYYLTNPETANITLEEIMKNQQKLIKLESKASQNKIMTELSDKLSIKNINIDKLS